MGGGASGAATPEPALTPPSSVRQTGECPLGPLSLCCSTSYSRPLEGRGSWAPGASWPFPTWASLGPTPLSCAPSVCSPPPSTGKSQALPMGPVTVGDPQCSGLGQVPRCEQVVRATQLRAAPPACLWGAGREGTGAGRSHREGWIGAAVSPCSGAARPAGPTSLRAQGRQRRWSSRRPEGDL